MPLAVAGCCQDAKGRREGAQRSQLRQQVGRGAALLIDRAHRFHETLQRVRRRQRAGLGRRVAHRCGQHDHRRHPHYGPDHENLVVRFGFEATAPRRGSPVRSGSAPPLPASPAGTARTGLRAGKTGLRLVFTGLSPVSAGFRPLSRLMGNGVRTSVALAGKCRPGPARLCAAARC